MRISTFLLLAAAANTVAAQGATPDLDAIARRAIAQLAHLFHRLHDALHTRLAVLEEQLALARERGYANAVRWRGPAQAGSPRPP